MPAAVLAAAVAVLAACGGSDGDAVGSTAPRSRPVSPTVSSPVSLPVSPTVSSPVSSTVSSPVSGSVPLGVTPVGFDMIGARVVAADGSTCDVCLWRADDADERGRGLMGVTDLGAGDGMAFVYTDPTTTAFTMKNTLIPLSIAFFGIDGVFLDAFDMVPCRAEPCATYPTPAGFSVAVEVEQGGLDELLIGTGSRLESGDGDCPATG